MFDSQTRLGDMQVTGISGVWLDLWEGLGVVAVFFEPELATSAPLSTKKEVDLRQGREAVVENRG